ncbi:MAG: phosphoethanolamine--lipid A transferase [Lactobacillaceae bacterium]|nr:phosphoethanolamine--lipid A transferase [Lactobacillaceae bacterium]
MSLTTFTILYSLFILAFYNFLFFSKVFNISQSLLFTIGTFVSVLFLLIFSCNLFFWKYTVKPLAILLILINSGVLYFMATYKVVVDAVMLRNTLETDIAEVADLLSFKLFIYIFFLGLLPSFIIYKTKIIFHKPLKSILYKLRNLLISLLLIIAIVLPNYKNVSQFVRNNQSIKYSLIPVNYAAGVFAIIKANIKKNRKLAIIGEDARIAPYWQNTDKKNLFVFVVGETARAKNFSFGGYDRNTNEPLEKYSSDILYFSDVDACGTSTAVSVPCMFSKYERKKFKNSVEFSENFLDVMSKAGYKAIWLENNSGCKGNCRRIETIEVCNHTASCPDEKMVEMFSDRIKDLDTDAFVVLHQLGSHGPTYYKRYPENFEKYKPACRTELLNECSREEVVNVYDNTIYYTSHTLAQTIEELEKVSDKFNTVLIYVSDHGESLGEKGLYLHGAPYMIAPEEQTKVPLFIWMSDETSNNLNIDKNCLKEKLNKPHSHDNLFHTMLGLTGIETKERLNSLNIFEGCIKHD